MTTAPADDDVHRRLLAFLDEGGARYRVVRHPPEGRSEEISRIRGNDPRQAMKALVCEVRGGGRGRRHVLAIIPGAARLDMKALCRALGAQKGRFAPAEVAEELTGCVMGAVPPFSFARDALPLLVDDSFREWAEVCFNAGRLDRSIFLAFDDYCRLVDPPFARLRLDDA